MSFLKKLFGGKQKPLNWVQFTELFAQRISRDCAVEVNIEWGGDLEDTALLAGSAQLYLGNHYARYRQSPDILEEILSASVQVLRQMAEHEDSPLSKEDIMPAIKPTDWLSEMARLQSENNEEPEKATIHESLAGDIVLTYVLDKGTFMRGLSQAVLSETGLTETALRQTALDNLRHKIQNRLRIETSPQTGLRQVIFDSNYDASLALILGEILPDDLPANPIFAIPSRDALFVCSPANDDALNEMQQLSTEIYADSPYTISPHLYQYANGKISLFRPH